MRAVATAITANPSNFGMDDWFYDSPARSCIGETARTLYPALCGKTTATHDAQGQLLAEYADARYILDLTEVQADSLFFVTGWPSVYRLMYANAETDAERAFVAKERILAMVGA